MFKQKMYYGIRFEGNENTTTGEANKRTGRMSIACSLVAFLSKKERRNWVDKSDWYDKRICVKYKEIPSYFKGETIAAREEIIQQARFKESVN